MSETEKTFQKLKLLEIDTENPWSDDILDRRIVFEYLYELLLKSEPPLVFAIDSDWGTGKSFFMDRFAATVSTRHPTVTFNAWKNDFSSDAFFSFYSEIYGQLSDSKRYKQGAKGAITKFAKIGGRLALQTFPIILKGGLKYILGESGLSFLKDLFSTDTEKKVIDKVEKLSESAIKKHLEKKKTVPEFQEALTQTIDNLVEANENLNKPLFILIDELDRCRPTYAIQLLESIKHIFSTKDAIFILAIDKSQISHSLKTQYGTEMDASAYLARFIDQTYKLPKPSYSQFATLLMKRIPLDPARFQKYSLGISSSSDFLDIISALAAAHRVSLRDFEQVYSRIRAAILVSNRNLHLILLIFLAFGNARNPSRFNALRDHKITNIRYEEEERQGLDLEGVPPLCLATILLYFEALHDIGNFKARTREINGSSSFTAEQNELLNRRMKIIQDFDFIQKHLDFISLASPLS